MCCLAGCSQRWQAAFQLRQQMEFRPGESLQGSPVRSGNSQRAEQRLLPQQARSEQTQGAGEVPGRLGSLGNRHGAR